MIINRTASAIAATSILTLSGLGVSLQNASLQLTPAIAQTASCDTEVRKEDFSRQVGSTNGINLRADRRLDARTSQNAAHKQWVEFEGWGYGESVPDLWTGKPDAIWYKLKNQELWVPSAYMVGYPPSNPPLQPDCSGSGQVDIQGLMNLLFKSTAFSVTGGHGQQLQVWCRIYWDCRHTGIDLAPNSGRSGDPIYSPIEGKVIRRSDNIGAIGIYNQKSNTTFFFAHMDTTLVSLDSYVKKGAQLGTVGTKGYSTGSHLHFEARPGNTIYMAIDVRQTVNPLDAVNQAN